MLVSILIIILTVVAAGLFGSQALENRALRAAVINSVRPSRYLFLVAGGPALYMQKLLQSGIDARKKLGVNITSLTERQGRIIIAFTNGEQIIYQRVETELPQPLLDQDGYNDFVFVDYQLAPDRLYEALLSAGLRNRVYNFSIVDEKA